MTALLARHAHNIGGVALVAAMLAVFILVPSL